MTKLKLTGDKEEIGRILEDIKPLLPEIMTRDDYETEGSKEYTIYLVLKEPLQKDAEWNLQDWMIIEYCQQWRTTPQIKKYFNMTYDQTREICDRLFSSGALCRRLNDKVYEYRDRGTVHRCMDCQYYHRITDEDITEAGLNPEKTRINLEWGDLDGWCCIYGTDKTRFGFRLVSSKELNECQEFEDIQVRLGEEE